MATLIAALWTGPSLMATPMGRVTANNCKFSAVAVASRLKYISGSALIGRRSVQGLLTQIGWTHAYRSSQPQPQLPLQDQFQLGVRWKLLDSVRFVLWHLLI